MSASAKGAPIFTIRKATAADIPVLAHHRAAMFRDMGTLMPYQMEPLQRATGAYLAEAMRLGEYLAWLAEHAESPSGILGGAGVQLRPILPRPRPGSDDLELGPEAIVLNVYVDPVWRRRGIANALMCTLLDALSERGIRRIVLHASDGGRHLYERLGFIATNEMRLSSEV